VVLGACGWCRPARADEDDWQLSAQAGIASVVVDGRDPLGERVGGDVQYGLTDAWAVRASSSVSRHSVSAETVTNSSPALPGGTIWSYSGFAGLGWTMDVLRLLPSFEAGVGVLGIRGAVVHPHASIGMQVGVGADYLMGPRWSLGAVAEYVFAPFDLLSNALTGNEVPQAFALSARIRWILH
jgi:hypothetical protein